MEKGVLQIPGLDCPAQWDRRLNPTERPEALLKLLSGRHTDTLRVRRQLQVLLSTRAFEEAERVLANAAEDGVGGLEGVAARVQADQARYQQALRTPAPPASTAPLDIENRLDYEVARTIALTGIGNHAQAAQSLYAAEVLAELLDMPYRRQWLMIERARQGLARGEPNSELFKQALEVITPSERRTTWGTLGRAEALLAEGDYSQAWLLVQELQPEDRAGLDHFLEYLLGHPPRQAELEADRSVFADITRLAHDFTARTFARHRKMQLPEETPERSFALTLKLAAMCSHPSTRAQAVQQIEQLLHGTVAPAQRVMLHTLLLSVTDGHPRTRLSDALLQYQRAFEDLPVQEDVWRFLARTYPDAVAPLAFLPNHAPQFAELAQQLPIITGQRLRVGHSTSDLPGRSAGSIQIVRHGYFGPQVKLHGSIAQRVNAHVATLGYARVANLGRLLRLLVEAAHSSEAKGPWAAQVAAAFNLLDSRTLREEIGSDARMAELLDCKPSTSHEAP